MKQKINFRLNGRDKTLQVDDKRMLLWVLRNDLKLTGCKYGCGEGYCGSCTVVVDREAVRSCQYPVKNVIGKEVITIEGLADGDRLHPLQQAFMENDALQCGYCTPGMILNAYILLLNNKKPTRNEIVDHMEDNLCRCGSHVRIIRAIEAAGQQMSGGRNE